MAATALCIPDLRSQVALVTGASLGIGAAVARACGAQGMRVAVHFHSSRGPAEAVAADIESAGGQALLVQGDVRDPAAIARCVAEVEAAFGEIAVLVNNAGSMVARVPLADQSDAFFDEVMHTNGRSVVAFTRAVLPGMRRRGGGSVVSTTSVSARSGGTAGASLYAASKGFVSTLTRSLARELAADRIRVNAVAPGVIQTPLQDKFSTPEMLRGFTAGIPLGRIGTPEDCVGAYLYLASEALSGYMTGQVLEVNGGQLMP